MMKAWLKGGLIGLGVGIILNLAWFIPGINIFAMVISSILSLPLLFLIMRLFPAPSGASGSEGFLLLGLSFLSSIVSCMLLGALIGWIVGKIRSNNVSQR